jgi:ATP-dependent RNA helicase RhlE
VEETPRWEKQAQARTIDGEMRKRDPNYKGAFHEKKKKTAKRPVKKGNRPPKAKRG